MDFKPSPIQGAVAKFAPKAVPGIFLGYVLQPGGLWKGDFLAAKLSDFASGDTDEWRTLPIHRIREVVPPESGEWVFPLKEAYDRLRRSISVDGPSQAPGPGETVADIRAPEPEQPPPTTSHIRA